MKLSIINLVLWAIILVGMSACTQQERVATEHSVATVDSVQQIVRKKYWRVSIAQNPSGASVF